MLNTLVNILIQNTTSHMSGENADWTFKIAVPFVLMLFFGEIMPKYIGLKNNITLSDYVAPMINFLQNFFAPLKNLIIRVTTPISRILFFFLRRGESISKEELKHVLEKSQEHGVLNQEELELIWGFLNLQDATVKQLMRPREDILFYDINDPLSKLIYLFVDQECSRVPVCNGTLENVLGIITARQFFLHRRQIMNSKSLIEHLVKPLYIPENMPAKLLGRHLDEHKQVIALVVDEYRSISGLVTREDLAEEVIGEISDLRDTESFYMVAGPNQIIATARMELQDFNDVFHADLKSDSNILTIGGWLIEQLQEIPKEGTKFKTHGFLFQVLAADPTRIRKLYIQKLESK